MAITIILCPVLSLHNHINIADLLIVYCKPSFSALKQIRKHLNQGNHKKALAVLKAAMVTWPEYSMFVTSDGNEEPEEDEQR